MKKSFTIACIAVLLIHVVSSCISMKDEKKDVLVQKTDSYVWLSGMIFANSFINKVGEPNPDIQDYYFHYSGTNYFIKLSECNWEGNISDFNMKWVKVRGEIRNGLWDTDDPNVQSRTGNYVVFSDIEVINQPLQILFVDGSANRYEIKRSGLHYDPVSVIESSSGIYSGGTEKTITYGLENFMEIYFLIEEMRNSKDLIITERVMGSGYFKIDFPDNETEFIVADCQQLTEFKMYLDELLERFSGNE
jgi:hypothetical protein